jgi:hypothetical protein
MSDGKGVDVGRISELREQLQNLPGQRVMNTMRDLDIPVRYVLVPNGVQLDQHLAGFEAPAAILLWAMGNEEQLNQYLHEVSRLTHNLVASVASTIDHTRNILNAAWPEQSHPIRKDFVKSVQVFQNEPGLVVVRDLRNFVLHRAIPAIVGQLQMKSLEGPGSSIRLSTANLLEWDGWKKPARSYLEEAGDSLELRPLTTHYLEQAITLHQKTLNSIQTHEQDVLAPWQALATEHDELAQEVRTRVAQGPSSLGTPE